jgi:hypothetical protein
MFFLPSSRRPHLLGLGKDMLATQKAGRWDAQWQALKALVDPVSHLGSIAKICPEGATIASEMSIVSTYYTV